MTLAERGEPAVAVTCQLSRCSIVQSAGESDSEWERTISVEALYSSPQKVAGIIYQFASARLDSFFLSEGKEKCLCVAIHPPISP